ncbi:MAG: ethanolamine ammonia-lyase reactivating factor EutA [Chloroflexi bacterium]|nr:ethanolamine ammonia-lyase reactivating factor EutA [Chloroflexota bacterium]
MHDEPWAHIHDPDEERLAKLSIELNNPDHDYYHYEVIELTTVGIDIGSSTSHLMFSSITLQRVQEMHSSRYVVVDRQTLYKSPILLTPYTHDNLINTEQLERFVAESYAEAGFEPQDVDSGAIILTGEAIKRRNAHAIADIFADQAGKFVCASAGHNLESVLAANGSGSVKLSRNPRQTVLNVDIGGGTTKFALVHGGRIQHTAALNVGGRLVATDDDGSVNRIEDAAHTAADSIGVPLALGEPLPDEYRTAIADALAECLLDVIQGRPRSELTQALLLTPDIPLDATFDALVFSGGVSEYVYSNETREFGDLAVALAAAVRRKMEEHALPAPVQPAAERIRATVIGASQFTVQLSGNTLSISDPSLLPYRNVPVLISRLPEDHEVQPEEVAALVGEAFERQDLVEGEQQVALAFEWDGLPRYAQIRKIADGIVAAAPRSLASGAPLMLVFTGDFAKLIGETITKDMGIPNPVISIDNLFLQEFDFIDIGEMIYPARVVPVVVKSLLFPEIEKQTAEVLD